MGPEPTARGTSIVRTREPTDAVRRMGYSPTGNTVPGLLRSSTCTVAAALPESWRESCESTQSASADAAEQVSEMFARAADAILTVCTTEPFGASPRLGRVTRTRFSARSAPVPLSETGCCPPERTTMLPDFAPTVLGRKVIVTVQDAPIEMVAGQLSLSAKSPVTLKPPKVRGAPPVFVSVTVSDAPEEPTSTASKLIEVIDHEAIPAAPVPDSANVC